MKLRSAIILIAVVILIDQALKIWIKTSFTYGPVMNLAGLRWARLYFLENPGMAWGMEIGGNWGKMILTLFRLVAVIFGSWYLVKVIRQNYTRGFIVCASLIYAGALGNLIDSMFYGLIFGETTTAEVAKAFPAGGGYSGFLHGKVVDMLYFPFFENAQFPSWMPFVGGDTFTFFSPIFNIADAAISVGVITLLAFQKQFMRKYETASNTQDGVQEEVTTEEVRPTV